LLVSYPLNRSFSIFTPFFYSPFIQYVNALQFRLKYQQKFLLIQCCPNVFFFKREYIEQIKNESAEIFQGLLSIISCLALLWHPQIFWDQIK